MPFSSRRIIFTPNTDLKDELAGTAVQITCYDRNGDEVKHVTSSDAGNVEDNENTNTDNTDNTDNTSGTGTGDNTGGTGDSGNTGGEDQD